MEENKTEIIHHRSRKRTRSESPVLNNIDDLVNLALAYHKYNVYHINIPRLRRIRPYLEELSELIGMRTVKEMLFHQIVYYLQDLDKISGGDFLNTVIYGPPGSGKTTLSYIIANIFSSIGVLSENTVRKVTRADLIAGYLGQTAIKTKKVLDSAAGGVLLIDEVYSLGSEDGKSGDSFSKECIDTINQYLSENKDLMVIVCGYESDINRCFFKMNDGLKRRFMWFYYMDEYTDSDLALMLVSKVLVNNWNFCKTVVKHDIACIIQKYRDIMQHTGGDIDNIFTLCKMFHSKRVLNNANATKGIINLDDIAQAFVKFKQQKTTATKESLPHPLMYT